MKTTALTTNRRWQAKLASARVYAIENGAVTECLYEGSASSARTFLRLLRQREASVSTLVEKI